MVRSYKFNSKWCRNNRPAQVIGWCFRWFGVINPKYIAAASSECCEGLEERNALPTHRRERTPGRNPDGGEAVVVAVSERIRIAAVDVRSVETDHGPARDAVIGPEREAFAGDKRIAAIGEIDKTSCMEREAGGGVVRPGYVNDRVGRAAAARRKPVGDDAPGNEIGTVVVGLHHGDSSGDVCFFSYGSRYFGIGIESPGGIVFPSSDVAFHVYPGSGGAAGHLFVVFGRFSGIGVEIGRGVGVGCLCGENARA